MSLSCMKHFNSKTFLIGSVAFASICGVSQVSAQTVGHASITAASLLSAESGFPLSMIADGITGNASSLNGFVTNSVGTISFEFDQDYDLSSFLLWNDIVVVNEGIDDFSLRFFDSSDSQITTPFSADYIGPVGQVAAEEYVFDVPVLDVRRVELEVFTTQFNYPGPIPRIEIREVDFGLVPEPSSTALLLGMAVLGSVAMRRRA